MGIAKARSGEMIYGNAVIRPTDSGSILSYDGLSIPGGTPRSLHFDNIHDLALIAELDNRFRVSPSGWSE